MSDSPLTIRSLTTEEIPDLVSVVCAAFLDTPTPTGTAHEVALLEPDRTHGVFDGDELIGGGSILSKSMTLPGGTRHPVAAVTIVGVAPGHRRRGATTMLMREQLHGLHNSGAEPFASLFASEGGIYGRFGYGLAAQRVDIEVPKGSDFLSTVDVGKDRVRDVTRESGMPIVKKLHDEVAATRVGWLTRSDAAWEIYLGEDPDDQDAKKYTPYRFALHPEGYAIYKAERKWGDRGPESVLHVREIVATTTLAYAALWRYLLDVDLIATVEYDGAAADEPVQHLLEDPYQANHERYDSLWVRIVDVDRALPLRRYAAALDVVLELTDEFCPWNEGRWRLVVDAEGVGTVERTEAEPDLAMTTNELGAIYLGGTTVLELAAAQRIRELRPGTLLAASRAFTGDHQPHCPEVF